MEQCLPCPAGTFLSSPSNEHSCSQCADGFFSEVGQEMCQQCVGVGVTCDQGIITMKGGFWCESCQKLSCPRKSILPRLNTPDEEIFHRYTPSESCIVNVTSFATECATGYLAGSPVCDTCQQRFVKIETGECIPVQYWSRHVSFRCRPGFYYHLYSRYNHLFLP